MRLLDRNKWKELIAIALLIPENSAASLVRRSFSNTSGNDYCLIMAGIRTLLRTPVRQSSHQWHDTTKRLSMNSLSQIFWMIIDDTIQSVLRSLSVFLSASNASSFSRMYFSCRMEAVQKKNHRPKEYLPSSE